MSPTTESGKRVLLVDDNIVTQETISLILGAQGYQVATAPSGQAAFEWLRQFDKPNLILLDLHMPGMDGRTFCQELSHDPKFASIPIVVFSADVDIAREASNLGAVCYVQKPVDSIQLLTALRRCCP